MASIFALEYLRDHHEIAQEPVAWHVHDLDKHGVVDAEEIETARVPSQSHP